MRMSTTMDSRSRADRDRVLQLTARYANLGRKLPPDLTADNLDAVSIVLDEMNAISLMASGGHPVRVAGGVRIVGRPIPNCTGTGCAHRRDSVAQA